MEIKIDEQNIEEIQVKSKEENTVTELEKKLSKSLFKAYIYCAIPPFLSILTSQLLIFVDGIVVTRLLGTDGMAAITYSQVTQSFIQGSAQIISTGSISVLTALTGNEQDIRYRDIVPSLIFWLNLLMSLFDYAILLPTIKYIYEFSNAEGKILQYSLDYSNILIYFCPVTIFFFTYTNALLAEGLSGYSMTSSILASVLDAPLSFILVKYTNFGIQGAAVGSIIACGITALLSFGLFFTNKTVTRIRPLLVFKEWKATKKLTLKILTIGLGDGFAYFAYSFTMALLTYCCSNVFIPEDRSDGFAAIGALQKLLGVMNSIFLGLSSLGYLPIAGFYVGAKNKAKFKEITTLVCKIVTTVLVIITIFTVSLNRYIGMIFSTNEKFLSFFEISSYIALPTQIIVGFEFVYISIGQALGMNCRLIISSLLCLLLYQPVLILIFYYSTKTFLGVMFNFPITNVLAVITCFLLFKDPYLHPEKFMDDHVNAIGEEKNDQIAIPADNI